MTTLSPPATIAFIGLGMMGRPMAARLAKAGFKLRLYDLSQKAVSDFIGAHPSALATASPKAAAQGADAVITMLPGGKRAIDGSLSIMVGGNSADLERARPAFAAMSKAITLCGPAGAGHALKALNNYLSAAGL